MASPLSSSHTRSHHITRLHCCFAAVTRTSTLDSGTSIRTSYTLWIADGTGSSPSTNGVCSRTLVRTSSPSPPLAHGLAAAFDAPVTRRSRLAGHQLFLKCHNCSSRCNLVHGNFPVFKGTIARLHEEQPPGVLTCAKCEAVMRRAGVLGQTVEFGSAPGSSVGGGGERHMWKILHDCCCSTARDGGADATPLRAGGTWQGLGSAADRLWVRKSHVHGGHTMLPRAMYSV